MDLYRGGDGWKLRPTADQIVEIAGIARHPTPPSQSRASTPSGEQHACRGPRAWRGPRHRRDSKRYLRPSADAFSIPPQPAQNRRCLGTRHWVDLGRLGSNWVETGGWGRVLIAGIADIAEI